ncbi:hypothetical protein RHGRI_006656 [Rhododendron griersonianum]|uniref:Uncharacterized protein n=1 Tax=Rhododendron griersonianum TaxID=479676 RepID=A0AAV6KU04_9ERIC|nr:hypothetical protein RHGRI_006656 [Rhododendron griersonianum]
MPAWSPSIGVATIAFSAFDCQFTNLAEELVSQMTQLVMESSYLLTVSEVVSLQRSENSRMPLGMRFE